MATLTSHCLPGATGPCLCPLPLAPCTIPTCSAEETQSSTSLGAPPSGGCGTVGPHQPSGQTGRTWGSKSRDNCNLCSPLSHLCTSLETCAPNLLFPAAHPVYTHIWCEDLNPSRLLFSSSILKAEGHSFFIRIPPLHLVPLKCYHLVLHTENKSGSLSAGTSAQAVPSHTAEK